MNRIILLLILFIEIAGFVQAQNLTIVSVNAYKPFNIFRGIENEIRVFDSNGIIVCDSIRLIPADQNSVVRQVPKCRYTVKTATPDSFINLLIFCPNLQDTVKLWILNIPKPQLFTEPELVGHRVSTYVPDSVYAYARADRNKVFYDVVDFQLEIHDEKGNRLSLFNTGPVLTEKNKKELQSISGKLKTGDKIVFKNVRLKDEESGEGFMSIGRVITVR